MLGKKRLRVVDSIKETRGENSSVVWCGHRKREGMVVGLEDQAVLGL